MENPNEGIPSEMFELTQLNERIFDEINLNIKPIGYFKDAFIRFCRNKASVAAAIIIIIIVLFAIITPFVCDYKVSDVNGTYAKMRPKLEILEGFGFWDGGKVLRLNDKYMINLVAMGIGAEDTDGSGATWDEGMDSRFNPLMRIGDAYESSGTVYRDCRVDSYYAVGFQYVAITMGRYEELRAWEQETGIQAVYPMVDTRSEWCDYNNAADANFWYRHAANSSPVNADGRRMSTIEDVIRNGGVVDNYLRDDDGNIMYYMKKDMDMLSVRVLAYNYYQFLEGHEPIHVLGTDAQGYDILVRLASGIRLSLILAVSVSLFNLTFGAIYGAIEGYYGGTADLVMERISDILNQMPNIVIITLFQLHLVNTGKVSSFYGLLLAFVAFGWIGTAYSVRTQFYRFKNQEYILAARTLGARDARLMFRHILPNAIGTIITSSVLVIPGVILYESITSYLGVVNFNTRTTISLGTMLSNGQSNLATDPHIIMFPAVIISLLMISFNLFGNGLRDAFNPSLRGTEDD